MNLIRLMRLFLPLQNPAGFTLADFLSAAVAFFIVLAILLRDPLQRALRRIAARPPVAMVVLTALPALLRLSLLANHPVPSPTVSDDFSYLLLGDTLAHFRLANATHPLHRFFETVFVLQEPSYSSIYPPGQGIALAAGHVLFGNAWLGILLSASAVPAAVYWMLRGWVSPPWAFAGGLLAVMQFGPLNQWMNNYWGGALSAIAGCMVFGSFARRQYGAVMGAGLGLQILTRPFEAVLLLLCLYPLRKQRPKVGLMLALAPALLLTLAQNRAVTGSFTTLPYMLSRTQYGIPTTFTFQQNPLPQRELNQEQRMDYEAQKEVHGDEPESLFAFSRRLAGRAKFVRFFLLPPLYVALLFLFPALREKRIQWAGAAILIFFLGSNLYPYFYPHYIAAVTCLFILLPLIGLMRMPRGAARLLLLLCGAHFLLWYGVHLFGNETVFAATGAYESWDYINFGDAEGRLAIDRQLLAAPGRQLVFVHYSPQHGLREWVHNEADIDNARIVWALDLGTEENAALRRYYPARTAWLVEPDSKPPSLVRYPAF